MSVVRQSPYLTVIHRRSAPHYPCALLHARSMLHFVLVHLCDMSKKAATFVAAAQADRPALHWPM